MTEIYSQRIDKDLFTKEIDKNLDRYSPKLRLNIQRKKTSNTVEPSVREHYSQAYKVFKRIEYFLHTLGLSKLVFSIKKAFKKINFKQSNVYTVQDFSKFHDEEFIKNVYLGVLKREVDKFSLEYYLSLLRSGSKSKAEILAIIRFSKEGKIYNVPILGIKVRYLMAILYKIPFVSYVSKTIIVLFTLPKLMKKYNSFEANYFMNNKNIANEMAKKVNLNEFRHTENLLTDKYNDSIKITQESYNKTQEDYTQVLKKVELYLGEVNNAKSYLRTVESNLQNLIRTIEKSIQKEEPISNKILEGVIEEKEHLLDNLYISFEDKFRGSREDIKKRQKYYLPLVQEVLKSSSDSLVDVGCGRGEWLELLSDYSISAKGVDLNRSMVNKSLEYGLDALTMDAITYLRTLKNESVGAVTGFHIVEHLPFEVLVALFDESLRVLKKGGIIIFETPNPENLLVGACTFYTDPTHLNPIPPITLEFLAQNRGFSNVEIHRLHPIKEPQYIEGMNRDDINNLIYASTKEQDYSIVGYKI